MFHRLVVSRDRRVPDRIERRMLGRKRVLDFSTATIMKNDGGMFVIQDGVGKRLRISRLMSGGNDLYDLLASRRARASVVRP
jgi:hypothetical protein